MDNKYISELKSHRPLGYERVYLPLYKVADTPFYVQGDDIISCAVNMVHVVEAYR